MKRVIDCFTFYNELEVLELRLTELYDVVDKFILVEAEKTHKGENKRFIFEENKWRFEKWLDKIIHVKVYYPSHIEDPWGREKFQRNSFMPTLYSLGLDDSDIVFISDVDEIVNPERANYIKKSYDLDCINKMEMTIYFGNFHNRDISNKWYHPKVVNWGTLKGTTPDQCRLTFDCQWWENGGWHLTYFGGVDRIINKLENFAHQEYNQSRFKDSDHIEKALNEGIDLFGEWRKFERIDPEKNPNLPNNWRILEGVSSRDNDKTKNLVLGTAIGLSSEQINVFAKSFREFNTEDDVYLITSTSIDPGLSYTLEKYNIKTLSLSFNTMYNMKFNMNIFRFYKYLDFVLENKKKYKNILLTDVTDVVFQSDPFSENTSNRFIIFSEEFDGEKIRDNSFNSRWVSLSLGDDVLEKIGNENIICAGTTIGSYRNILHYLKSMTLIMTEAIEKNPSIASEGIDQGIHNYIAREINSNFKNMSINSVGDFIATIGITCQKDPKSILIKDGYVEVNGKKPSIIHQYNRSEELNNFYGTKYKD
jgi:beta-1,4-mannosyl-glycoprotein beta-1,4-N-acetylglucosaminyltransferase